MTTLAEIYAEYRRGSDGMVIAIETHHPGFEMSRTEIKRVAQRAENADEFEDIWHNSDWWSDDNNRPNDKYHTINDKGRDEIKDFLDRHHKRPEDQKLDAWVQDANDKMNFYRGTPYATIEIRSFDAKSGNTESLTIDGDGLTEIEVTE